MDASLTEQTEKQNAKKDDNLKTADQDPVSITQLVEGISSTAWTPETRTVSWQDTSVAKKEQDLTNVDATNKSVSGKPLDNHPVENKWVVSNASLNSNLKGSKESLYKGETASEKTHFIDRPVHSKEITSNASLNSNLKGSDDAFGDDLVVEPQLKPLVTSAPQIQTPPPPEPENKYFPVCGGTCYVVPHAPKDMVIKARAFLVLCMVAMATSLFNIFNLSLNGPVHLINVDTRGFMAVLDWIFFLICIISLLAAGGLGMFMCLPSNRKFLLFELPNLETQPSASIYGSSRLIVSQELQPKASKALSTQGEQSHKSQLSVPLQSKQMPGETVESSEDASTKPQESLTIEMHSTI